MVRWAQAAWLFAVLGLGGFAMAQEGLIVDPWRHPSAPAVVEAAKLESRSVRRSSSVNDFAAHKPSPSVVPVGPPLDLRRSPGAVTPLGPAGHEDVVDPWASTRPAESDRRARLAFARRDWAWEVQEIVDPWATGPLAVAIDPAIVDPWAR